MRIIESTAEAVRIAEVLPFYWFRGHATAVNALQPRVFREDVSSRFDLGFECQLAARFRAQAKTFFE